MHKWAHLIVKKWGSIYITKNDNASNFPFQFMCKDISLTVVYNFIWNSELVNFKTFLLSWNLRVKEQLS